MSSSQIDLMTNSFNQITTLVIFQHYIEYDRSTIHYSLGDIMDVKTKMLPQDGEAETESL